MKTRNMDCVAKSLAIVLGLGMASAACALPTPGVQREIEQLLRYIGESGCTFNRNGTWHDAKAARAHVSMKYEFLLGQDRINTTEDFIEKAATKSSVLFGQPYTVSCDGGPPVPSSVWLNAELTRLREVQP
jgi:hypothetical protein